jgi:hypothetical protein
MKDIPAFPLEIIYTQENEKFNGMTLRDFFAAQAMQAIINRNDNRFTTTLEFVGGKAYQYADEMMKARQK